MSVIIRGLGVLHEEGIKAFPRSSLLNEVFNIKYCNTPRYVREGEKGFKCMKCGSYVVLSEAKVIKRVQTIRDAIYIVKELKLPEELRGKIPHRGA